MFNSSFPPGGLPMGGYPKRLGGSNVGIHNRPALGFGGTPRGLGLMIGRTPGAADRRAGGEIHDQVHSLFGSRKF